MFLLCFWQSLLFNLFINLSISILIIHLSSKLSIAVYKRILLPIYHIKLDISIYISCSFYYVFCKYFYSISFINLSIYLFFLPIYISSLSKQLKAYYFLFKIYLCLLLFSSVNHCFQYYVFIMFLAITFIQFIYQSIHISYLANYLPILAIYLSI